MAGFPRFELPGDILLARGAELRDDFWILRGKPVLQFVQGLNGQQNGRGDFYGFCFHG